ncbi:PP2C family protein-serine/threonine phosphatase [Streptomyces sp. NPDC101151]|uniref:PP2C family protein-serine/threonine phosphatase n=1 Tax=Streptomyces sp. NPDC101151 TaxID=3366115 RepID=UPI0038155D44
MRALLAKQFAAAGLRQDTYGEQSIDDIVHRVDELISISIIHAGNEVEVVCRVEIGRETGTEVEVICRVGTAHRLTQVRRRGAVGREKTVVPLSDPGCGRPQTGGPAEFATRFRLRHFPRAATLKPRTALMPMPSDVSSQVDAAAPGGRGNDRNPRSGLGPFFLAEASELLAGQLDEDLVAALATQLVVPRVADWCGVWLSGARGRMRLSRVWHREERFMEALRQLLEHNPPSVALRTTSLSLPGWAGAAGDRSMAFAFPLLAGGSCQGVLVVGTDDQSQDNSVMRQVENMVRLVAQAVATARRYAQQTTISKALQRRQLPAVLPPVPGIDVAVAYEPHEEAQTVGGDFYDLFRKEDSRWCFLLGDVQGKDPEAMSVTGLARHMVRLLAREGHGVESVLERLNIALTDDSAEAATAGVEHASGRFLTLLYGELEPDVTTGGARCRLASAGHPLPLRLFANGVVKPAAQPQILLGVDRDAQFIADSFTLLPGETLLCVTDGVTERRRGTQLFDDGDGLSATLRACAGMSAMAVANQVRQAVHEFSTEPVGDDLAVMVLKALPKEGSVTVPGVRMVRG